MSIAVIEAGDGSSPTWLGIARNLSQEGVSVFRVASQSWYSSRHCSTVYAPNAQEAPDQYIEALVGIGQHVKGKSRRTPVLYPSTDAGLTVLSQHRSALKRHFHVVFPDWKTTAQIIDKSQTYMLAQKRGIPIPQTFVFRTSKELSVIADQVSYPCLLKPAVSHVFWPRFHRKLLRVSNQHELLRWGRFLLRQGYQMLVQEEIVGSDDELYVCYVAFNQSSEPLAVVTLKKIHQQPPCFGVGVLVKSRWHPYIARLSVHMLQGLQYNGIAELEFKRDTRTKTIYLLEINGRAGTLNYITSACNMNLAYLTYKDAVGSSVQPFSTDTCHFTEEVKWLHLKAVLSSIIAKRRAREITLTQGLRSLLGKKTWAFFDINDPRPFISEVIQYFKTSL